MRSILLVRLVVAKLGAKTTLSTITSYHQLGGAKQHLSPRITMIKSTSTRVLSSSFDEPEIELGFDTTSQPRSIFFYDGP